MNAVQPETQPVPPARPAPKLRWGRYLSLGFVLFIALGLVGLLAVGLVRQKDSNQVGEVDVVRGAAKDFSFSNLDWEGGPPAGQEWKLSDLRGKVVIINFWASWCKECEDEAETLELAWLAWQDKDVVFLGLDMKDRESDAIRFLERFGITYPNGPVGASVTTDYGVIAVPETFVVDPEGQLRRRWWGVIEREKLDEWIIEAKGG